MRTLPAALFFACIPLLAGCPETVGQQCPSNSVPIGQYTLAFSLLHPADECKLIKDPDSGTALDASLGQTDAATQTATLCAGSGDAGAVALTLAVPGKASRTSELRDGGVFAFTGHTDPTGGTVCACALGIDETFGGTLQVPGDAGFALLSDGGFPLVTGMVGTLSDAVSSPEQANCLCNVPCTLQYGVDGTRF
jgi:hypothetical protein